jgi:hypothetical protein
MCNCQIETKKLFCTICGRFKDTKNPKYKIAMKFVVDTNAFDEVANLYGCFNEQNAISYYDRKFHTNRSEWYNGLTLSEKFKIFGINFSDVDIETAYKNLNN